MTECRSLAFPEDAIAADKIAAGTAAVGAAVVLPHPGKGVAVQVPPQQVPPQQVPPQQVPPQQVWADFRRLTSVLGMCDNL